MCLTDWCHEPLKNQLTFLPLASKYFLHFFHPNDNRRMTHTLVFYNSVLDGSTLFSLDVSTLFSVLDSKLALMYQPAEGFPPVAIRPSEVAIVGVVLCVWASAVYVFFNQWGKSVKTGYIR